MTVVADAEELQVDAAHGFDECGVTLALLLRIHLHTVRKMSALHREIHMIEQILMHEVVVALIVVAGQALILVEVHGADLREIEITLLIPLHQLLV